MRNCFDTINSNRCVAYMRCSTKKQKFDLQRAAIEKFCVEHNIDVIEWFSEYISGAASLSERVELINAANLCEKEGCLLVCYSYDRLFRSTPIMLDFFRNFEIDTVFCTKPEGVKAEILTLADYWKGVIAPVLRLI